MDRNPNYWYEDHVNSYGRQEIQREARETRMLKEAGVSGSNWLANVSGAVLKLFKGSADRQDRQSIGEPTYHTMGDK